MIDIAIIGSGPAGLSAAINAAARGRSVKVFGRSRETSWLYKAEEINNHLGMPAMSGEEMINAFYNHAENAGIEILNGRVMQVLPMGTYFGLNFENDFYEAGAVVIATGIAKGKKVDGEEKYLGKGVSYCATCDGMLFKGKDVVIAGEIEEGEADADFLANVAGKVYYLPYYQQDGVTAASLAVDPKVQLVQGKIAAVQGDTVVKQVFTDKGETIPCSGVFFVKASTPLDSLVPGLEVENGAIVADRLARTSVPGVFAAGDCTGWPFQVSNAIGEGLVAAQQADKYLREIKLKNAQSQGE